MQNRKSATCDGHRCAMRIDDIILVSALAVAIAGGAGLLYSWLRERRRRPLAKRLPPQYFEALSFLLEDQMDRALELLIELADRDADTVEFHFALGSLFRRKGELERATLIHQNLIARPSLSREQHELALKELGQDYMRAGLYDRAERIFAELLDLKSHQEFAARRLVTIYEQQQDWAQAAALRRRLEWITGRSERAVIAQYNCEIAETAYARGDEDAAAAALAEARRNGPEVPRVRLLSARAAIQRGDLAGAAREYQALLEGEPDLAEATLPSFAGLFSAGARAPQFEAAVRRVLAMGPHAQTPIAVTALKHPELRSPVMMEAIERELAHIVEPLSEPEAAPIVESHAARVALVRLITGWVARRPLYQCRTCGFRAHELYWHCPGCRGWGTMRMRRDVFPVPGTEIIR